MFFRKISRACAFAGMAAVGVWASAASGETQSPVKDQAKYLPIESIRYDFGSKSMSGYFVDAAATCVVMLMVSEKADPDAAPAPTATRVRLRLSPGQIAGLDSEEGRSLNLTCGDGARTLAVDVGDTERLTERQRLAMRKTASE